jgi:hypothetical protein
VVRYMNRYISSLLLASAIAAPTAVMAQPRPQEGSVQVRIYDRDHRDYHDWDNGEDRAYRRYLAAQHWRYREYHRRSTTERSGSTGIGATAIRTAISKGRERSESSTIAGGQN